MRGSTAPPREWGAAWENGEGRGLGRCLRGPAAAGGCGGSVRAWSRLLRLPFGGTPLAPAVSALLCPLRDPRVAVARAVVCPMAAGCMCSQLQRDSLALGELGTPGELGASLLCSRCPGGGFDAYWVTLACVPPTKLGYLHAASSAWHSMAGSSLRPRHGAQARSSGFLWLGFTCHSHLWGQWAQ